MTYTIEAMEAVTAPVTQGAPSEFDLPSKTFTGYDPKGTTTITGSPIVREAAPTEEAAAPPAEDAPQETVRLSKEISAIARKEQAHRQREMRLKQREREFEARLADADKYQTIRKKIEAKDYSAADELGLTYEEYTQYLLDKQNGTKPEEERYRKVEAELADLKRRQEETVQKEYQANQKLWQAEIAKVVATSEDYSTIRELAAEHLVLAHVNDSFDEDGIELTAEQAAKEVEEALLARAEKFSAVSKIKNKVAPPPSRTLGAPKSSAPTITNQMTVSSQKQAAKPFHLLSESEQIAEAFRRVEAERLARLGR